MWIFHCPLKCISSRLNIAIFALFHSLLHFLLLFPAFLYRYLFFLFIFFFFINSYRLTTGRSWLNSLSYDILSELINISIFPIVNYIFLNYCIVLNSTWISSLWFFLWIWLWFDFRFISCGFNFFLAIFCRSCGILYLFFVLLLVPHHMRLLLLFFNISFLLFIISLDYTWVNEFLSSAFDLLKLCLLSLWDPFALSLEFVFPLSFLLFLSFFLFSDLVLLFFSLSLLFLFNSLPLFLFFSLLFFQLLF